MTSFFTLQAPCSEDPALRAELACETFTSLDQARDCALSFVQEFCTDIAIVQHFGAASCVWEEYDYDSYGGAL